MKIGRPKLPPPSRLMVGCAWREVPIVEIARQMCLIDWHIIRNITR
jgi:hypothetical protein